VKSIFFSSNKILKELKSPKNETTAKKLKINKIGHF
jgi:hypothetical protein